MWKPLCYNSKIVKMNNLLALALALLLTGCASAGRRAQPDAADRLRVLDHSLSEAERVWAEAIDDPWTEPELQRRYFEIQDLCRECARRKSGFATVEEKQLCDRVRDPFKIYFNRLCVRVNGLEEQIEVKEKQGTGEQATVAYDYKRRPSIENLEKLRSIFQQVHRYYVGWPYTWTRYINKYPFQKSRSDRFRKDFLERDREYLELMARPGAEARERRLARRRAEFAFGRLKEEYVTNDLPPAGEVNAFYRARNLDEYHRLVEEESALDRKRGADGRVKEVVVFVHGLSETRGSWGKFPELLAREDTVNPDLGGKYFKVYVFSYDTVEDSKSVEGFKKELDGFIKDVLKNEHVESVHLIGHSFGAVLGLKYMNYAVDQLLEGVDRAVPQEVAAALVKSYAGGKFRQAVKSFTSVAGSLSGSEIANIAGDRFIPGEHLFRKKLPLFRGGVPGYGDIQVRENQIGSAVNLNSFWRLDTECPFDPPALVRFLPDASRPDEGVVERLRAGEIPVLCIIGDPAKIRSLAHKEGFVKLGEVWKIILVDGLARIFGSLQSEEDDGLVKSYSANLNHIYLIQSGEDIGYKGARARYTDYAHFSICRVDTRDHPTYRYVVSFLNGALNPQMQPDHYRIRRFGTLMRVFAGGVNPHENPDAYFAPGEKVVYLKDGKLIMPPLRIEEATGRRGADGAASWNVSPGRPQWNGMTGVYFSEGRVVDPALPARVAYRLSAEGYAEKLVTIPVRPGEVSYAVNVVLEKEGEHR
ncbi:MAG: hypothetical protein NTX71_07010 [Candidatus Aureabacteria bacterium]|nr:hypothetical protein [Candidatus Auribacterota bacterium]